MLLLIYIIEFILLSTIGLMILYLCFLSVTATRYKFLDITSSDKYKKFAIIIPAHNEELSIAKTILSFDKVKYPRELFEIYIIADNCTDKTKEISENLGAKVLTRNDQTNRGKGYALKWGIGEIIKNNNNYDAFFIIDADSVVTENIFEVLNYYLNQGYSVLQTADLVDPNPDSWSSEVTRLGFTLYNYTRPLGRKILRLSAGLKGNGMCITLDTFNKIPWNSFSLNEDLEYGIILLLNNITVEFVPETKVLATMPKNPENAISQRTRWERGRFSIIKFYTFKLLKNFLKNFSFKFLDALIELNTPPLVNLFIICCMIIILNIIFYLAGIVVIKPFIYIWMIILGTGILHILIGLYAAQVDKHLFKAFFYIPKYTIWKLHIYTKVFFDKFKDEWIRTTRES